MKILKLLNKKSFSILIVYFLWSFNLAAEEKPIDIWNIEKKETEKVSESSISKQNIEKTDQNKISDLKLGAIDQIKNISQEKKNKPEIETEVKGSEKILIESFDKLLKVTTDHKEIKLKYELEKNVNLVSFEKNRIEISFNDNLDKNFVKDLSSKLFDWTDKRWIISFSKNEGEMTIKQQEINRKNELIEKSKKTDIYKKMKNYFADAELIDIEPIKKNKIDE